MGHSITTYIDEGDAVGLESPGLDISHNFKRKREKILNFGPSLKVRYITHLCLVQP